MYQDVILRHYRAPHGRGLPEGAETVAERANPLCGDRISVGAVVEGGRIVNIGFAGRGCSIATASASMLTDAVRGLLVGEALALVEEVGRVVRGETIGAAASATGGDARGATDAAVADAAVALGDLAALAGVAPYSQRHGCALMAWLALRDALIG
jgi:nitrogen fixation protein NifU and related proteins